MMNITINQTHPPLHPHLTIIIKVSAFPEFPQISIQFS